jgi:hypothetical protein
MAAAQVMSGAGALRDGRRRREHEPGADGQQRRRRGRPTRGRPGHPLRAAGHQRRPHRHPVRLQPAGRATLSRCARRRAATGLGGAALRPLDRPGARPQRPRAARPRRAPAAGHHAGEPRQAPAGLRRARGALGFDAVAQLQRYPGVERIEHVHTRATRSGIVDGASAILVGSKEAGERLGLRPRARIRSFASVGSEPTIMLTGPADAAAQGAPARWHVGRRHRPVGDQRGLRLGRPAVRGGPRRLDTTGSTSTAGRSRSGTRWAPPAR